MYFNHAISIFRCWKINLSVGLVYILQFYNICLTYFHIKTFVCVDEEENILPLFCKHSVFFFGQCQHGNGFSNFNHILCLQYAWNSRTYLKVGTWMVVWHSNILCNLNLRHLSKRYKTFEILSLISNGLFLFLPILESLMFFCMCSFFKFGHCD